MRSLGLALSCIGMSALLIAGCGNQSNGNNGVTTKNANRAHTIQQNSYRGNANQENNVIDRNYRGQNRNGASYRSQSASTNGHVLQLGDWLSIIGTRGHSGMGTRSVGDGMGSSQSQPGKTPEHQLVLNVSDPEAIAAIDRINDILSNRSSVGNNSDTLLNDLSLVLQKAAASNNGNTKLDRAGTANGMGTSGVTPNSR
ncbi:hypothetical protein [Cohnella sp. AR92]|uniref:hypothetical protein n=1 Tax=Cohnella sp. AR92 TaxID=648716 RepID=UPI000F8E0D1E|nr:hypothetical protein [Cohnella sp. AR92]RUS43955.1 hypothetical protein ELR57_24140 [Cohnella sp. AR92]